MAFIVDDSGNITLIQGDSGTLVVNGLPTDKNYTVYFGIRDSKRNPIGSEIQVQTNGASAVSFVLSAALTDLLTVRTNEDTAEYYYGVKLCYNNDGTEDTLILGDNDLSFTNTITVYPKRVEGIINA